VDYGILAWVSSLSVVVVVVGRWHDLLQWIRHPWLEVPLT
jgi:hypothetical protein